MEAPENLETKAKKSLGIFNKSTNLTLKFRLDKNLCNLNFLNDQMPGAVKHEIMPRYKLYK